MAKISVIVPAYNAEQYISKCIDSIVNQTLKDIEIIIVNDGSTDKTEKIIQDKIIQYKNKDIKYLKKKNGGLSDARNFGINKATGDYIAFVDSDDYIEADMLYKMYEKIQEYPYDIVVCDVNCKYPDKDLKIDSGILENNNQLTLEDKKKLILSMYVIVCNKIYKRDLFTEDRLFMKGIWYEDVLFSYKLIPFINSVGIVKEPFYNYIQRENSITYTYNDKLYDINKILNELINYYTQKGIIEDYDDILEYVYVRYMFATFIKRLCKCKDKKKFNKGLEFAIRDVKKRYPKYKKNRFIKESGIKGIYLGYFNKILANIIYIFEKDKMN